MLLQEFQSTRPRGARREIGSQPQFLESFNPRAHVGRDVSGANTKGAISVSIHAPTWGATLLLGKL